MFFALWPDAGVREALASLAREAQAECGGRATPAEKIHMTLFFVGGIERTRIAALGTLASAARAARFDLQVNRVGYWRRSDIVWAGSAVCPPALSALVASLRESLSSAGFKPDERPYVPHATLVRDARRGPKARSLAPLAWRAHDFALVESAPAGGGVHYEVITRYPLGD